MSIVGDIVKAADGMAFGVPGGGPSLEVIDAIERAGGRFYTVRFEGAAALMAGAVGRLSGRPGVAVSIKGPGLANMTAGLATVMLEDFPVLAVAEAFGRGDSAQKAHKRLDQDALSAAITKARCGIGESDAIARLSRLAMSERPGPVLLELAETAARWPGERQAPQRDASSVLRKIDDAQRPVVIAGGLALRLTLSDALNRLAVPVFSTAATKGIVDERLPHAAGVFTGAGLALAPERDIIAAADLVVGIGLRTHEVLVAGLPVPAVNIDDLDAAPGFDFAGLASTCDASRVLAALATKPDWATDRVGAARATLQAALLAGPFLPAQVFDVLARRLPDARMVLDTGYFCTVGEHLWNVRAPALYLSSGQGRSMGASLPMAVAAAISHREQPTVLAIGDGGIGMFAGELLLAVAERAPLLVLLMRDGTYASIRDRAVAKDMSERSLIPNDTDWAAVASAMGFASGRAERLEDLADFIDTWGGEGPAFVDIRFAPEPYRTMTAMLRA